jgi:starch-binding outer membrane protein, SusD/RagB family
MKKYILLICGMITLFLGACKKQLTETPYSFLTPANFYQTAADAQSAIEGCLSALQPQAYYQRTIYIMTELPGDCLTPLLTQNEERIQMYKIQYPPTNPEIDNWWVNSYNLISRTNNVIANVPNINMNVAARNNILGNAYFLRGMAYFDLVRSFGDAPFLLRPVTGPSDTLMFPHKTNAGIIYKQLISDLQFAEANCLPEPSIATANKGMVSSGAASAMLARVYLQRASSRYADPADNQNALAECNKVINSNVYKLMPVYSDVFNWSKKFYPTQTEVIFAVQFGANGSNIAQNITCRMFSPSALGGSGSFLCNLNFFNNGYPSYDTIRSDWNIANKVGSATVTPFIHKYRDPSWVAGTNNSQMNWIILRYADVLLMQSEAMNNLNPADPGKFAGIDSVQSRAGIPSAMQYSFANVVTQSDFIDSLVKERPRELCVEGHRRWDLIRLGAYQQVEAAQGFTIQPYQYLLPIPQGELDANPNLVQNPGYQ